MIIMSDNSIKYADEQMIDIKELGKYLPDDYKDSFMNIIRLSLIEAYRKGWNDSEKFFDGR
ncbi:hypothetical protein D3C71_2192380 [compost metagenome]